MRWMLTLVLAGAIGAVAGCQTGEQGASHQSATGPAAAVDSGASHGEAYPPGLEPIGSGVASGAVANTYTIAKGDTLWSIALRVYGDGQRHVDIARANPGLDPQRLPVGREIILP